jgi:acetyl esterase/lipase
MKKFLLTIVLLIAFDQMAKSQEIIQLPKAKIKGITYENAEKQFYSQDWQTTAVTNVSEPTLTVFEPSADKKNGTSVIIAPGGGLYALSINSEGIDVAQWLVAKGVTAFVLKYHLVPTGEDGTREIGEEWGKDYSQVMDKVAKVLPTSIQDGLNAVAHVRQHAEKYNIHPDKIGFMGFSAGGAVTMGVGYGYNESNRPDFLVPVYPWTDVKKVQAPKADAPPMLIICATNDGIGLAKGAIELYSSYFEAKKNVALHMYSQGDHGFGMKVQGLPSDNWIERFYEWAVVEELIVPRVHN